MNNVFKFVSLRPAQTAEPDQESQQSARYDATAKSPLHTKIEALTGDDPRAQAIQLALDFMKTADYIGTRHAIVDAVDPIDVADAVPTACP